MKANKTIDKTIRLGRGVRQAEVAAQINVVVNWYEELKRLVQASKK